MPSYKLAESVCDIQDSKLACEDELARHIKNWTKWDRNEKTLSNIVEAVKQKDWATLRSRLSERISFGTAGLRAPMREGFDSMNDLTVVQTAQGLAKYLGDVCHSQGQGENPCIVFGYDGRHNSKRFAKLSAVVFLNKNFRVYLFQRTVATPFVPFTILQKKCVAGVMVTASHNPKEDNGYKVYWANGAQIIPPIDKDIQNAILASLQPEESSWDLTILEKNSLLEDPFEEINAAYFKALKKQLSPTYLKINKSSDLQVVYTAMHGVGYPFVEEAFQTAGLKPVIPVLEQRDPDPDFPTVPFPNPEEGKSALNLAFKTADDKGCTIILANDPDADRLAVAELVPDANGEAKWKIFNGNEIGALLGWWALKNYKLESGSDVSNCVMIASTVSSKILKSMAKKEGFIFYETLTGFKWMGNKAIEAKKDGKIPLFAFEEAIGFMMSTNVLDKDGVSAAAHIGTLVANLLSNDARQEIPLSKKLKEIYDTYGYHTSICSYVICSDQKLIKKIFNRLRTFDNGKTNTYPTSIKEGKYAIVNVRDLTTGYDSSTSDKRATLPVSSSSQMITFTFKNGSIVTLRTSGTEPKMKYYAEICGEPTDKNWEGLTQTLKEMVEAIVEEFYEPTKNGLKRKAD